MQSKFDFILFSKEETPVMIGQNKVSRAAFVLFLLLNCLVLKRAFRMGRKIQTKSKLLMHHIFIMELFILFEAHFEIV